jgi:hypothetical protein
LEVCLGEAGWEIATIVPFGRVAVIGLLDKLNSFGAVGEMSVSGNEVRVGLRDGGVFGAYCVERPRRVLFEEAEAGFLWEGNLLKVEVARAGTVVIVV